MTCVWDSIVCGLNKLNFNVNHNILLNHIKNNNKKTDTVKWNGETISEQMQNENYIAISNINISNNGYLCSTCDPLMLIICELYNVSIEHSYNDHKINYTMNNAKYKIRLSSNNHHMSWVSSHKN